MNIAEMKLRSPRWTPGALAVLVVVLGIGFLATVLVPGLQLSSELVESSSALKFVSEQQRYPTTIRASLDSLHDRLMTRAYFQESMDQLRDSTTKFGAALPRINALQPANSLAKVWAREQEALAPLLSYNGVPYLDSEATGTALNQGGQQLERDLNSAIRVSRHALPQLDAELTSVAAELQSRNAQAASRLRLVMLGGLAIAGVLVALVTVLIIARQRQEETLRLARQQTADILRTVKDGLFLLDRDLLIGAAYSGAMESLFQRTDLAGLPFESLLKDIVSEKTLATALKFVKVLWAERTNEKLVKSINPLSEVEIHLDVGHGRFETRYLEFDFHRVRLNGSVSQVLVAVSDVSGRVDLARKLEESQSQAQAQVDTLLGILHIDPVQLGSFLSDSNAAMKMINAVLREPAREESVFRKKLDTLFRQAHAVKGEAAALGLSSIESRAHAFEEDLKSLKDKPDLSGNDFLPLVIKLDDLMTHLQSVGELVARFSRFQPTPAEVVHARTDVIEGGESEKSDFGLASALQQLAARVASDHQKEAVVRCEGFEAVPAEYRRAIKDIAIQAVRNAIVHGIETASDRKTCGKLAQGQVRLSFQSLSGGGYKFTVEDDGQGLAMDRIKEVAVRKGFITAQHAAALDPKQTYSILFRSGFSTVELPTKDAGRGMGMNLVADLVQQVGGRVGVATAPGRFTRFTVTLPAAVAKPNDEAAVA